MHELSIALSLLEAAEEVSVANSRAPVLALHLRLGALAGVDAQALEFAWTVAAMETAAAGAKLVVVNMPVRGWCSGCAAEREAVSGHHLCCRQCGEWMLEIRQGRELELTAVELATAAAAEEAA
ncbi:MAG: hydrogenase maturation nickel metallochaperone HypA [Terriglobales bacterium]